MIKTVLHDALWHSLESPDVRKKFFVENVEGIFHPIVTVRSYRERARKRLEIFNGYSWIFLDMYNEYSTTCQEYVDMMWIHSIIIPQPLLRYLSDT